MRRAAIISVKGYTDGIPLDVVGRDCEAMHRSLSKSGYQLVECHDPDRDSLTRFIGDFIGQASNGDVLLAYFSCHGYHISNSDLLVLAGYNDSSILGLSLLGNKVFPVKILKLLADNSVRTLEGIVALFDACRSLPPEHARLALNHIASEPLPDIQNEAPSLFVHAAERLKEAYFEPNGLSHFAFALSEAILSKAELSPASSLQALTMNAVIAEIQPIISERAKRINKREQMLRAYHPPGDETMLHIRLFGKPEENSEPERNNVDPPEQKLNANARFPYADIPVHKPHLRPGPPHVSRAILKAKDGGWPPRARAGHKLGTKCRVKRGLRPKSVRWPSAVSSYGGRSVVPRGENQQATLKLEANEKTDFGPGVGPHVLAAPRATDGHVEGFRSRGYSCLPFF